MSQTDPLTAVKIAKDIADTHLNETTVFGLVILIAIGLGFAMWRSHLIVIKKNTELKTVNEQRVKDVKEYAEDLVDLHDKTNVSMTQMIELIKQIRYDSKR